MARSRRPTRFETSIDLRSVAGLLGADLGRLALDHGVALGRTVAAGLMTKTWRMTSAVEELPQRRQVELLGRDRQRSRSWR